MNPSSMRFRRIPDEINFIRILLLIIIFINLPHPVFGKKLSEAVLSENIFTEETLYDSAGAAIRRQLRDSEDKSGAAVMEASGDSSGIDLSDLDSPGEAVVHKKIEKLEIDPERAERADKKLQKYFSDREFVYDRTGDMPLSFWDEVELWLARKLRELFSSEGYSVFVDYLSYALLAFAVIMIILAIFRNDIRGLIYGRPAGVVSGMRETEEDIHRIDLDKLLDEAISNKEFRAATRIYYLKSLKLLSERNLINWQINKTNKHYILELNEPVLKNSFSRLTRIFEFVWYGEFKLDDTQFASVAGSFKEFNSEFAEQV